MKTFSISDTQSSDVYLTFSQAVSRIADWFRDIDEWNDGLGSDELHEAVSAAIATVPQPAQGGESELQRYADSVCEAVAAAMGHEDFCGHGNYSVSAAAEAGISLTVTTDEDDEDEDGDGDDRPVVIITTIRDLQEWVARHVSDTLTAEQVLMVTDQLWEEAHIDGLSSGDDWSSWLDAIDWDWVYRFADGEVDQITAD